MAHSSHFNKKDLLIDLFNLQMLPDGRKAANGYFDILNNFFLPDVKKSRISQIINRWMFDGEALDDTEGFLMEITYL